MKNLSKKKKAILLLYSYIILLFIPKIKDNKQASKIVYNNSYSLTDDCCFASYNDSNIYIINKEQFESASDINPNDIYILDERDGNNPNIKICDSYKIKSRKQIIEILNILLEFENRYPSNWDRTVYSMANEWLIHNVCYDIRIKTVRTGDVDLDNDDEEKYESALNSIINIIRNIEPESLHLYLPCDVKTKIKK